MNREALLAAFPEIELIPSTDLRDRCVAVWLEAIRLGGWEEKGLENCSLAPGMVSDDCPERGIDHCRGVVKLCKTVYDAKQGWWDKFGGIDENILLAGAVLHDVGKYLEYDYVDGKPCHSKNGHLFKHVVSGAYLAQKHGLPEQVVHMVLCHSDAQSPEGGGAFLTPELLVLKYVDHMLFSFARMNYKV